MKSFRLSERTSVHLDLIRGVSAWAVMFSHLRGLFFADYPDLAHPSVFHRLLYALTGFGHQAVIVFFILSGYFIGASVCDAVSARRWSWRVYLINRLTRLQLVLLPALVLGAVCDQVGMRLPQAASFYYGELYKYYLPSVALRSTVPVFFGNLFFLQNVISPVFGSNGPLWSLSFEFWYYILFPALLLAAASWARIRYRALHLFCALLLMWFVGPVISLYFLIWLAGAGVGRLPRISWLQAPRRLTMAISFGGLVFASALAWSRLTPSWSGAPADFFIGVCFALWLFMLVHGAREDVSAGYARIAKRLSGFSYTLYLVHFPALLLLRGLLDPQGNWQPDLLHLAYGLAIAALILGFAYLVAEFTEGRTAAVRRRLLQPWAPRAKEAVR